jgi:unsaturated rhamnogalacturonyl hydrolase
MKIPRFVLFSFVCVFTSSALGQQTAEGKQSQPLVLLDSYFNNETKQDEKGTVVRWHYKWEEQEDGGFSIWGEQFRGAGFRTSTLYNRPTRANLRDASVYIIVDPDTEKETEHPNYIGQEDIREIEGWVRSGGILLMMGNDIGNAELDHFNDLAARFGAQFNKDKQGAVTGDNFEMGAITIPAGNQIFKSGRKVFIKEFSSLKSAQEADVVLKNKEGHAVVIATKAGKGTVILIGDPWLYNEYVSGRRLPKDFQNQEAGQDLINWLKQHLSSRHLSTNKK